MLTTIKRGIAAIAGRPVPPRVKRIRRIATELHARFDAAAHNDESRRRFAGADSLSASAALIPQVRHWLRTRCRYVADNNSYFKGMLLTLAYDVVGPTGPRLQMQLEDKAANRTIEKSFANWSRTIDLAGKLQTMRMARAVSGEVLGVLRSKARVQHPVTLDLRLFEADHLAAPSVAGVSVLDPQLYDDGITFSPDGDPLSYDILRRHPGDRYSITNEYDRVPAAYVIHYFRKIDRPGICRGIPEIAPSMWLAEELRRYTQAVLAAAETAADYAMVIQSNASDVNEDGQEEENIEAMDTFELTRRMTTVLPKGYSLAQTKPEQPTTAFGDFSDKLIREFARSINMPFARAALDFSKENLSATYMGDRIYANSGHVDRAGLNRECDVILREWLREAAGVVPGVPRFAENDEIPHAWFWPRLSSHADPVKNATAQGTRLSNCTSNLARELAEDGRDWEDELSTTALTLGITVPELQALLRQKYFNPGGQQPPADGEDAPPSDKTEPTPSQDNTDAADDNE